MLQLTATITGKTETDLVVAIDELSRLVSQGFTSGSNRNEDGDFVFAVTGEEEEPPADDPCPGEAEARAAGYQVVTLPDDPGKFYWKTREAVAFVGAETIEAAWLAACDDAGISLD